MFPSYREPGGNVALEAMSYGLPLVVCERGGPGANVDETCAFRLAADSPEQLASDCATAVRLLVSDPSLRLRMGAAARARAAGTHLWEHRVDQMARLYAEVAGVAPVAR